MINPPELNTDELYFADKSRFSVSSYKQFLKCEYSGTIGFGQPTSAMLVGSYVDAYVSGELEKFVEQHPEIISSRGATKGSLKSEFALAEEICKYIDNDKVFSQFMSGDKQTVMTGEIAGVPWRIKMDSYSKGIAISDLKVMANITNRNGDYIDFVTQFGYDIQMAVYQNIVFQNTGERLPCFICAVSKTEPINSIIINIPQHHLDAVLYEVKQNAPRFWEVKNGLVSPKMCGKCNHCIQSRKTTPIISLEDLV